MYELILSPRSNTIVLPDVRLAGPAGSSKADMMLDCGAVSCFISWNDAVFLGYVPSDHKTIPVITGNGVISAPVIVLRSLTVGDIRVRNVPAICHDIPELQEARGLIGLSFLKHIRTVIDYRALRLQME